jgi:hypothetical protein
MCPRGRQEVDVSTPAFTIQEGMEIFGADGKELGTVSHVVRHTPPDGLSDALDVESGYLIVDHKALLGLAAKHYYVPFAVVRDVAPADCVTLSCTKDECGQRYSSKPEGLQPHATGR